MGNLSKHGRWAQWEAGVLSRVADPQKCQQVIRQRQLAVDDDQDEANLISECIRKEIRRCGHNPNTCVVFVPTTKLAELIAELTGERRAVTRLTPYLKTLSIPELRRARRTRNCAGWIWCGVNAIPTQKPVPI